MHQWADLHPALFTIASIIVAFIISIALASLLARARALDFLTDPNNKNFIFRFLGVLCVITSICAYKYTPYDFYDEWLLVLRQSLLVVMFVFGIWMAFGGVERLTKEERDKKQAVKSARDAALKAKTKPVIFPVDKMVITYQKTPDSESTDSEIQSKLTAVLRVDPDADLDHYEHLLGFRTLKITRPKGFGGIVIGE
ncbi:MAG: hypothetical protein ABSC05_24790 [Candidatus Solibacter sp.]|jgi:hypothetical protein